jgi:glycosyltransferase involved in cell wall biosynthesis
MKANAQTLIILAPGFPESESDSTCLPAQQAFVRSINATYPATKIIILSFQYPFSKSEYLWHGNQVIAFGGKNRGNVSRLLLWRKVWQTLNKLFKNHQIAGILSFWCGECALVASRFARKKNITHYCWILGQDARKNNRYVNRIKPHATELIAMSDFLQKEFFKNHRIYPAHIITNGIDAGLPLNITGERDIDVFGAGSLIPLKQYDIFIFLMEKLKAELEGIKSVICGNGPQQTMLQTLIEEQRLTGTVTLLSEQTHTDVIKLMGRSKILLHTSSYEGFSTVCLEAIYAGAHVISFCKPMNNEIGHWHVVKDKDEMLQKLLMLLKDAALDHQSQCPYNMHDSAKQMMRLFLQ